MDSSGIVREWNFSDGPAMAFSLLTDLEEDLGWHVGGPYQINKVL